MKEKHRYIYKINCLVPQYRGYYYIGAHVTDDLEKDNYLGSGKKIQAYFKKFGKKDGLTYTKEILSLDEVDSTDKLFELEKQYIGNLWKTDQKCLNMKPGGDDDRKNTRIQSVIVKNNLIEKIDIDDPLYKPKKEYKKSKSTKITIPTIREQVILRLKKMDKITNTYLYRKELKEFTSYLMKYGTTPSLLRQGYYGNL